MPVHPGFATLLQEAGRGFEPPLDLVALRTWSSNLLAHRPPRQRVADVVDLPATARRPALRRYRPLGQTEPGTVLYCHGGGWVGGGLDFVDDQCARIASDTRRLVFSVAYRLAPEHPYPAPLDDVVAAIDYLRSGAEGSKGMMVAAAGESAGANLVAGATLLMRERGASPLIAQVLLYPPLWPKFDSASYAANDDGYLCTRSVMRWCWAKYLGTSVADCFAAPLLATNLDGLPPALVFTAQYDPLRDDGALFARRLEQEGGVVEHVDYAGAIHSFIGFGRLAPFADDAHARIASFLDARFAVAAGGLRPDPTRNLRLDAHGTCAH